MAKSINKLSILLKGYGIFLKEGLRSLCQGGIAGFKKYFWIIKKTIENERVVEYENKAVIFFFIPPIPSRPFNRLLKNFVDSLVLKKKKIHLINVLISVTQRCPYNCWYCSNDYATTRELSFGEIENIVAILREWGVVGIGLTGGEPLLRDDIDELIRRYVRDFSFIIFSSGYGLDKTRAERLKKCGLTYIAISLDDYDEERNDQARGKTGAYQQSIKAINNARMAGLYTIVQTVVSQELLNNRRMESFFKYINELDVDELLLLEPYPTGRAIFAKDVFFFTEKEHSVLKYFHDRAVRDYSIPKIYSFAAAEDRTKFGCGAGLQHAYIDTNGNFWPCNFLPISLGSILKEPENVKARMVKYFSYPCADCILTANRKELYTLARKHGLPIPFEQIKDFLEQRVNKLKPELIPEFYQKIK